MQTSPEKIAVHHCIHTPAWQIGNPYQSLLAQGLQTAGWQVTFENYPRARFPLLALSKQHPDAEAIHLHWIHPYIEPLFWCKSKPRFYLKSVLLALDVLFVRLRGVHVVWTVHNLVAHESQGADKEIYLRRLLTYVVNRLVFHSQSALETYTALTRRNLAPKSSVIPHGNYVGVYKDSAEIAKQLTQKFGLNGRETVILFFGAIRHYKGLPNLIKSFQKTTKPNLRLIIAGKALDADLQVLIEKAAEDDSRIRLDLRSIPDDQVAPLFAISHAVAIPFERTLTSGSAVLALSMGKALILPESARVLDIADDDGAIFFADTDHLTDIMGQLDCYNLAAMGQANAKAAQSLGWTRIGQQTSQQYKA